jgi:hypothetical protein
MFGQISRPSSAAGIWENWRNPSTEARELTFAVITLPTIALVAPIHHLPFERGECGKSEVNHATGNVAYGFTDEEVFMHFFKQPAPPRFAGLGLLRCFLDLGDVVSAADKPPCFDAGGEDDFATSGDPMIFSLADRPAGIRHIQADWPDQAWMDPR